MMSPPPSSAKKFSLPACICLFAFINNISVIVGSRDQNLSLIHMVLN